MRVNETDDSTPRCVAPRFRVGVQGDKLVPMTHRTMGALLLVLAACTQPVPPATAPAPAPPPDETAPPLPPIPRVEGPLAIHVQYPSANQQLTARDSNFIFGSIGNGSATLTINGYPARVYPNGAFMAFIPVPSDTLPQYELVARTASDSASIVLPVRVPSPRIALALDGPLVVDSGSASPRGAIRLRGDEPLRVSVRAPANASAWFVSATQRRPLASAPAGVRSDSSTFAADLLVRDLAGDSTVAVVVARGADTVRLPLARVELADSGARRVVQLGPTPVMPDTDRVIIGRPIPGGTYKWFFLPGTVVEETGRRAGFVRVRLDSRLEVWVNEGDVVPLPESALLPRRVAPNARVRSAPEYVDLVIPIGERPPYFVEEGDERLSLVLYGVRANTDIIQYVGNDTLLHTVQWVQESEDRARFVVDLRQPLYGYLVMWEDPGNLVLRIRRVPRVDEGHPLRGQTIVVDPGHPPIGATGPTGFYEGEAVLRVSEHLRTLLEQRGAHVVMTRTTMDPVDLGLRPIIARRANGNAFVSIHLNAYPDGVNVFQTENGSGTYFFRNFSEPLARPIQRGLVARMGLPNLGVYYDNLAVVRQTWMPSVLTEGAFVIMPEQEAALRTPQFQERYARGIADGLEAYFRWLAREREER